MDLQYRVENSALPNQLRVVTIELPHLHTATVALYVRVGSRFEEPETNGLSHFVEHMLYRGSATCPTSWDLNHAFEMLGSSLQGETGRDYSLYQISVEPENITRAIELLADVIERPMFGDIERERAIILEEASEDYNEDGAELNSADIVRGLAFGSHPLAQRIVGPPANVARFTRQDIVDHHRQFYCAANCILAVAGPVTHNEVMTAAQPFARLPQGHTAASPPPAARSGHPHYQHVSDPGSQTTIDLTWRGPAETEKVFPAIVALLRVLDDGMATRLHYRLCDQRGLAYSLGATIEPLNDTSLFEVVASSTHSKVPELVAGIAEIIDEFGREKVGQAELDRAKARYRYDVVGAIDDPGTMISWFAGALLYASPPSLTERVATMEAVTVDDVAAAARHTFQPSNLCAVTVGSLTQQQQSQIKATLGC